MLCTFFFFSYSVDTVRGLHLPSKVVCLHLQRYEEFERVQMPLHAGLDFARRLKLAEGEGLGFRV